jgi:hypothetical protein
MPNFKKHKDIVMESLEKNENSRNCDWELFFDSLERVEGKYIPNYMRQYIKNSAINFKTLMRERQRIQSSGLFPPTDEEVLRKRKLYQEEYTEHYSEN